jgi:bifunctional non-homologous end joining protein LigD
MPDNLLKTYRTKRDFKVTSEPGGSAATGGAGLFVVQKHAAKRAGLHWDFRLEHGGVLWSWAVPKGPSLDPADKRLAIHVEDHPIDYAEFHGTIPDGAYGGGEVETWDRGHWQPIGDPDEGMRKGELSFTLSGRRLNGRFTLVRLRNRDKRKAEAWFLIKGHDDAAQQGATAPTLEKAAAPTNGQPAEGAVRRAIPANQTPQLCDTAESVPDGEGWISEIKFDGYRLLAWIDDGSVRLLTRNGHDWAERLPAVAKALARLSVTSAVLDGELVVLREDGASSFSDLQSALSDGRDAALHFYLFDLLALNGWDMRPCTLLDRKRVLEGLDAWRGMLRYSAHVAGQAAAMQRQACEMKLEGIICKRADAPYRAGRGRGWVKVKCLGREEFVVLGWTPPAGRRAGFGALHLGYFDPDGGLHYAGGVGTGFSGRDLADLRARLDGLQAGAPRGLLVAGDPPEPTINWVRPELVVEVEYTAWSGAGRLRHAVFLGLRGDKDAADVVREPADPTAARSAHETGGGKSGIVGGRRKGIPPVAARVPAAASRIVVARAPKRAASLIGNVEVTHPDRELWPGITKRDLAEYWLKVAKIALPGLSHRPLSIVRCPDGIGGEHFFQKNGHGHLPVQIRENSVAGSPYLAIDDADGLVAMAQMSAIDLHPWGASEADPLHPDRLVFDLDPGEDVAVATVVAAARDVRERLEKLGLASFCRTSGGKGLHVVVPLTPGADWPQAKAFCHAFAETMAGDAPAKYVAHVKIADRKGRVLIDWLRNGLGATAVASFSPRSRPGAGVATPLAWREVTAKLDPAAYTLRTVPDRLAKLKTDPWEGFAATAQSLPDLAPPATAEAAAIPRSGGSIVVARKPKPRAR